MKGQRKARQVGGSARKQTQAFELTPVAIPDPMIAWDSHPILAILHWLIEESPQHGHTYNYAPVDVTIDDQNYLPQQLRVSACNETIAYCLFLLEIIERWDQEGVNGLNMAYNYFMNHSGATEEGVEAESSEADEYIETYILSNAPLHTKID